MDKATLKTFLPSINGENRLDYLSVYSLSIKCSFNIKDRISEMSRIISNMLEWD